MYRSESTHQATDIIASATQFINSTASHIFLTGKAGTGKTTFLRNLAANTHKQFIVVAPTGIAALNAGGVTIHSQFLLPMGMFIPEGNLPDDVKPQGGVYTPKTLAEKHPINSARKQVLRSIELLVIDEVSMLRADLLEAVDYRLKAARGNFSQRFGGVQLLLIGDLYQLPPVVKREEEHLLRRYYGGTWFFESKALQQDGFVYIELDKIFRQQDDTFINLLNNLRNNNATQSDIEALNRYYKSDEEIRHLREVITLTTHNYKADELNTYALQQLETPVHVINAFVGGDFPESMFPVAQRLELKEGAQVMFIKNDNEDSVYFNGKLATVKKITGKEVTVKMADSHVEYTLKKVVWENKQYTIDPSTNVVHDDVIGTFEQYPIKLAWAITIHKSQGLTFDRAIIDVGQAFADGQVYVALSRLRSLDGLILRSRINPDVIRTDRQVATFTQRNNRPDVLPEIMKVKQREYIGQLINVTFDFGALEKEIAGMQRGNTDKASFDEESMQRALQQIASALESEKKNTITFRMQLHDYLKGQAYEQLVQRIRKGSEYYTNFLRLQVNTLLAHLEEMKLKKRMKGYVAALNDLDQIFSKKLEEVDKALYLTACIVEGRWQFDFSELARQRAAYRNNLLLEIRNKVGKSSAKSKRKKNKISNAKNKKEEPSTYDITLDLFKAGMSIEEIAKERGLAASTIEGHLAKAVAGGHISIDKFMSKEDIEIISNALTELPDDFNSKDLYDKMNGKFSYSQLRAVMSHTGKTPMSKTKDNEAAK